MYITVEHDAHEYVMAAVRAADSEIGGIAYVELIDKGHFHISEFVMLEQEASMASVDIEGDAFIKEITKAAEKEEEHLLRCSWHSHPTFSVYFSGTDEDGIKSYKQTGTPWLLSLVYNQDGEIATRVDIFDHEISGHITISDIEYVIPTIETEATKRAQEDVKKYVKPAKSQWITKSDNKNNGKPKYVKTEKEEIGDPGNNVIEFEDEDDIFGGSLPLVSGDIVEETEVVGWNEKSATELFGDDLTESDWEELEMHFGVEVVEEWRREEELHARD
jgi:proteasome lid subunit RPN8/RPN11